MLRKRKLGGTGLEVTEIGFGALEIGRDWAADCNPDPSHLSESGAGRLLNALLDRGINFIDTAPAYWFSEEFIGKAISHRRDEFILATKVGEHCDKSGSFYDYSGPATHRFIDQSLKRLRTDVIDLLQIHSASMEVLERGETLVAMQEAQRAGRVRHIGMTGGVAECVRAIEIGGYETVQFPYNMLNISAEEKLFPLIREKGVGAIIMRGLAGGKLTSKYRNLANKELADAIARFEQFAGPDGLAALATRFVLAQPLVSSVIVGTRRIEAVDENLRAAEKPLDSETLERVREYARSIAAKVW
jgi:aryl-alcohol dehydrogenase-like predicted oxidoreductase